MCTSAPDGPGVDRAEGLCAAIGRPGSVPDNPPIALAHRPGLLSATGIGRGWRDVSGRCSTERMSTDCAQARRYGLAGGTAGRPKVQAGGSKDAARVGVGALLETTHGIG